MKKEEIENMKYFLKLKKIQENDKSFELINEVIKDIEKNKGEEND